MIRTDKAFYPTTALSHPGMTGKNNEDRYGVSAYLTGDQPATPALLAVLADGIGGHRAGEVASEMAVEMISEVVSQTDGHHPLQSLEDGIIQASQRIYSAALGDLAQEGMGSTCVCALILNGRLYTASVGDSRVYLLRGGCIQQLSYDHTWIQEAIEAGILTRETAAGHPNAHVIRRYLGSTTPPEVDFRMRLTGRETDEEAQNNQGLLLLKGDRLLLCSDGLTDLVGDQEILETFQSFPQDAACQALVDLANERGGHDNITLIAVTVPAQVGKAALKKPARKKKTVLSCALLAGLAALFLLLAGGWYVFYGQPTPTPTPTESLRIEATLPLLPATLEGPVATATLLPMPPTKAPTGSPALSGQSGPSLTPWPTHTFAPTTTPTAVPSRTP